MLFLSESTYRHALVCNSLLVAITGHFNRYCLVIPVDVLL